MSALRHIIGVTTLYLANSLAFAETGPVQPSPVVSGLSLMNAETGDLIESLKDGDKINLNSLKTRKLNIRAEVIPGVDGVTQVVFQYDQVKRYRVEAEEPYTLAGDKGGKYAAWTPKVGEHTVIATPYSRGKPGRPFEARFVVVNEAVEQPTTTTLTTTTTTITQLRQVKLSNSLQRGKLAEAPKQPEPAPLLPSSEVATLSPVGSPGTELEFAL